MRTYSSALKTCSAFTLAFFSWVYLPLYSAVAFAATETQGRTNGQKAESGPAREKTTEEKFQETLDRMREAGNDHAKLKAGWSELGTLDVELQKQFKETEVKIKDLPEVVKQRHRDFVKKYTESMAALKTHLDDVEKTKTETEARVAVGKARAFLEKNRPPRKHVPLDPNRLPHQNRVLKAKAKEPRLKKEEFERDFPTKHGTKTVDYRRPTDSVRHEFTRIYTNGLKHQVSEFKPILLAFNEIASDAPLQLPLPTGGEGWGEGAIPQVAFSDSSPVLLAQATIDLPTDADLAETPEVRFTPELRQIATLLENNPVQFYEFVRNNFIYDPYYGSVKGSQGTLLLQNGNDFDQISTLIGLFRVSGIPARYVIGTAEIPVEKVMKWVGVAKPELAAQILATNGIPAKLGYVGSTLKFIQLERVWAEVYISYSNYRGIINDPTAPKTWIPLDPAFKFIEPNPEAIDLADSQQFDIDSYLSNYLQTVKPATPAKDYLKSTMDYVTANIPGKRFYDLLVSNTIIDKVLGLLPDTLPYPVRTKGGTFSTIPDSYRHRIALEFTDPGSNETVLAYTASWAALLHNRFTLSYIPATAADEQTISNYGDIYSTPPYLIKVKPVLKVEGTIVAEGSAVGMAGNLLFKMSFYGPQGILDNVITNYLTVGAPHAVGLGSGYTTGRIITYRTSKLEAAATAGESGDPIIGEYLNLLALNYLQELDSSRKLISKSMKLLDTNRMAELMVGVDLGVSGIFSIPRSVSIRGLLIDVDYNTATPVDMAGDQAKVRRFQILTGMTSSVLEHSMFESIIGVEAISTIKALQIASAQGIPLHHIDASNLAAKLSLLQLSSDVKTDIQNAVNAGKVVTASERNIQLNSWNGAGYVILDPSTGAGAYMISSGLAGGSLTWITRDLQYLISAKQMTSEEAKKWILAHRSKIWFTQPAIGPITSKFGLRDLDGDGIKEDFHPGIDIKVEVGTPVYSIAAGTVQTTKLSDSYGWVVYIDHGAGVQSRYAHNSYLLVSEGKWYPEGSIIAASGNTGKVKPKPTPQNPNAGAHVHFEIRLNGEAVNPQEFAKWFFE